MRRPIPVICLILILFLSVLRGAGDSDKDRLLLRTEQILADSAGEDNVVTVYGTVSSDSRLTSGMRLYISHIKVVRDDQSDYYLLPNTQMTIITEKNDILPGDHIKIRGELSFWEKASNPGQFDAKAYYFGKDTVCALDHAEIMEVHSGKSGVKRGLSRIRRMLEESFYRVLDEKTAGTIAAICLGEKGGMDAEWKRIFQEGGIAHILAVSGLHITMIGMGIYRILRRCFCPIIGAAVLSGVSMLLYAVMTGFGVSAQRAVVMFFIWLGAQAAGRKYDMLTSVSAAAICLLLANSRILTDASFLLSFSAVLVLAMLVPCIQKTCQVQYKILPGLLIWYGTLPVTLTFFYQTAPWSFLLNLIVVPLMGSIMIWGLASAVIGLFWKAAGIFLAAPVYYLLHLFEWLCQKEQMLPWNLWVTGKPDMWRIICFYGVMIGCGMITYSIEEHAADSGNRFRKRRQSVNFSVYKLRMMWISCAAVGLLLLCPFHQKELRITCLDVGQGDCAIFQMPTGENFLVDGGSSSEGEVWKYRIEPALKAYGISYLDGIFLSHADADHMNGIKEYLQEYETGFAGENVHGISTERLYLPPTAEETDFAELRILAKQQQIEVQILEQGQNLTPADGKWKIHCLAPIQEQLSGDKNMDSMVLMVEYNAFRMLFTGDLEGEAERALAISGEKLKSTVLKVCHHGSANGSGTEFLGKVLPEFAVISCGKDNRYGHPAKETLNRLKGTGSKILITAQKGAVTILSDGKNHRVKSFF